MYVAEDPLRAVARGTGIALKIPKAIHFLLDNNVQPNWFFKIYQSIIYFIIFFSFSTYLLFTNNSYHSFLNKKTFSEFRGYSMSKFSLITQYLSLKEKNKILLNENVRIKNQLSKYSLEKNINFVDYNDYYLFKSARVINNSVFKRNNFLTLNKGSKDGIKIGQGVIINDGIVGIVKV